MTFTEVYAKIKAGMKAAGHDVSEGEQWLASDAAKFKDYCHFTLGVAENVAHEVLAFPATFEKHLGHIFTEVVDKAEEIKTEVESLVETKPAAPVASTSPAAPAPTASAPTPAPVAQTPAPVAAAPAPVAAQTIDVTPKQ